MAEQQLKDGLYWRPLGGNNIDQISGHCYQYTNVVTASGEVKSTTIVVDLGKFDNHQALGIKNSAAAVPDIRGLLQSSDLRPEAIFLTHSHPDHLNGIVHYINAGYSLPPLFGGYYTKLILRELYKNYDIDESRQPPFIVIKKGDVLQCGSLMIEVLPSSHTCFDSFGLFIENQAGIGVYHTGDMKLDSSTYFRSPTDLKRLKGLGAKTDFVVADFCGICAEGFAVREADTFKKLVSIIKKHPRRRLFIPVYPTHAEMYLAAFLAVLKCKKNVIFYGDEDFYGYLRLIKEYGIDFIKLAKNRIKVRIGIPDDLSEMDDNFAVIGTFNNIGTWFEDSADNAYGIITSGTFFNPLRGQLNSRSIPFCDVSDYPVLQGYGHGFIGDYEQLNQILQQPTFIPTHCPLYVIDSCRPLAQYIGMNIAKPTACNNHIYRLEKDRLIEIAATPAVWLAVSYINREAVFTEVWQKPTSGTGFLKRTLSAKRCKNMFKMMLHRRKRKEKNNGND